MKVGYLNSNKFRYGKVNTCSIDHSTIHVLVVTYTQYYRIFKLWLNITSYETYKSTSQYILKYL